MIRFSVNDFDLVKFFSYDSRVVEDSAIIVVNEYDKLHATTVRRMKKFFNDVRKLAGKTSKEGDMRFTDNRTVFLLKHKKTGTLIYFGDYEYTYYVGFSATYGSDCKIYDFKTNKWIKSTKELEREELVND